MNDRAGHEIEFLPFPSTEYANQMIGMSSGEGGVTGGNFVGDPSAAGH